MPYGTPTVLIINSTPIVGGTPGEILFVGAGNVIDEDPALFWDNTTKQILTGSGSATNPSYSFSNDPNVGMYEGAGSEELVFTSNGSARLSLRVTNIVMRDTQTFGWSSTTPENQNADTVLARDAANTLAQRNGTNAQTINVYNTFTDASNFERARIRWSSNALNINTDASGTGTVRGMNIFSGTSAALQLGANNTTQWRVTTSGHFVAVTDNVNDIGATGATRPRSIYVGTSIQIEANNGLRLTNQTDGAAANAGTLANAPSAGDPAFWLPVTVNGNTRYIPCWA